MKHVATILTIREILRRLESSEIDLQPGFQRGAAWSRTKQQLLIDSVLRGWHVPPIHLVRSDSGLVMLDGQQRLSAIKEFANGRWAFNGTAEPESAAMFSLHRQRLVDMPEDVKDRFYDFSLTAIELVEFLPEEPYELFFRLNQPATLTGAEKRNAFFGHPRDQIKDLTRTAQLQGMDEKRIGFSNKRLAFEDVIARFVFLLEKRTLKEKLTATALADRYRGGEPFAENEIDTARKTIDRFFSLNVLDSPVIRLNKATAQSWLYFTARLISQDEEDWSPARLNQFVDSVEHTRTQIRRARFQETDSLWGDDRPFQYIVAVFNERATARVSDVSSVLIRDASLWVLWAREYPSPPDVIPLRDYVLDKLEKSSQAEHALSNAISLTGWGEWE